LISAGPCYVLSAYGRSPEGMQKGQNYDAIQIGLEKIEKKNKIKKTMVGKEYKYIREFKGKDDNLNVGDEISVLAFEVGDKVKVSGMSKGKGFQGGVKRHGFHGKLSATHGNKHEHRNLGSVGTRFPQHVMKGRKMPGRMGFDRVSVKNLKVVKIDKDNNMLVLKGAVPGRTGALLEIKG